MDELLLIVAFAVVLAGALLFTNAVEWLGHSLGLGEGAVGSVLAAVGTAAPETLIAIVALLSTNPESEDVAIGAIVGAPFLLGTLAMGLVGLFAYLYRGRRRQGVNLDAHAPTLERDLIFFLAFFGIAGALAWGPPAPVRIVAGVVFLLAYGFYVRRTLASGGEVQGEETLNPLIFDRRAGERSDPPIGWFVLYAASWSASARWSSAPTSSSNTCSAAPPRPRCVPRVLARPWQAAGRHEPPGT